MQDLLGEVQAVDAHIPAAPLAAVVHAAGPQHGPGLAALSPGLQGHASARLPVEHPEEAVVRPRHDHAGERREVDMVDKCAAKEKKKARRKGNKNRKAKGLIRSGQSSSLGLI